MKFTLIGHQFFAVADPVAEYRAGLEQCKLADELGYDRFLTTEHHLSPYGGPGIFSQLAAFARETKRIRIGSMVVLTPIHHPLHIAEELAVIDILSDGRLDAGVGRGYRPRTMETFGAAMDDLKDKHEETVHIVKRAWTEETFTHHGRFYDLEDITVLPKPIQQPHPPLFQPVLSPPSIPWCLENRINPILGAHLTVDDVTRMYFGYWKEATEQAGDPGLERANQQICYVARTQSEAMQGFAAVCRYCREFAKDLPNFPGSVWETYRNDLVMLADNVEEAARRSIVGDPAAVVDRLEFYRELGVQNLILFMDFGVDQSDVLESMRLFAEHVMPKFK
ncbi:MAG: LLM class flavin-dependent oxidoreductase [Actinomycetota bacterium]